MRLLLLGIILITTSKIKAQNKVTAANTNAATAAQNIYHTTIAAKENIYNGQEYFHNNGPIIGHVFWNDNLFIKGSVGYEGNIYPNIPLKLDLLFEELVTRGSNLGIQIKIIKEKIDSFNIGGISFLHLTQNNLHKIPTGFYEVLHNGKYSVICRRIKSIKETVLPDGVERKIVQKNSYYLKENGVYYEIRNRQTLYNFFKNKREEVKNYIRTENLNFNKDPESFIVLSIKYLEQITQ
ncbi:MAG: hypothetical protein KF781_06105 [Chitinophagaceae bacterium]|nr:hypothetical protein [Chitinophagaceae bacterium]MCW5906031.1 hypothetical protein [Chitinophagaceae bacterium]